MERMRRVRNGTLIFYYVFTLCAAVLCLLREATVYNGLLVLAAFLLPVVPHVLYRLCHLRPVYLLEVVFDGFVLAAVSFASLFGGYELIPYWDKILHFLSGFLFAVLGTAVYFSQKPGHALDPADAFNASLYTWMFAMMSAVLWEIWEYLVSFSRRGPAAGGLDRRGRHDGGYHRLHGRRFDYSDFLLEIPAAHRRKPAQGPDDASV